jgi:hypothetical protein
MVLPLSYSEYRSTCSEPGRLVLQGTSVRKEKIQLSVLFWDNRIRGSVERQKPLKEKCVAVMTTKRKYYNSAQLLDAFESSSPLTNEHPTSVPQPSSYHQQPQTNCRDCPKRRSHQSHYQSSGVTIQSKVSQHHPQMARTIVLPVASHKYNHFAMLLLTLASTSRSVLGFASRSTFVSSLSHSKAWTARKYSSTTLSMKLQTAIVGLPNVGKVRTIIYDCTLVITYRRRAIMHVAQLPLWWARCNVLVHIAHTTCNFRKPN